MFSILQILLAAILDYVDFDGVPHLQLRQTFFSLIGT